MIVNLINLIDFLYKNVFKPIVLISFRVYYKTFYRRYKLPKVTDPIFFISAKELVNEIKTRKIQSEAVVKLYINRIKQIQPILNCVVDERFNDAIKEAQEIEKILDSNENLDCYPLLGVPFTCKELIGVKGMKFTSGVVCRKNKKGEVDADIIKLMKNAGAILICTTNVSELGLWYESANHVHGQSRNPYDTRRMVGGSSGGEGCIISACGSLIGLGTDIAGSIRIPSCFNGIYGHKPSNGLISNVGQHPSDLKEMTNFMLTSGPMCRYSVDLDLVLNVILANNRDKLINFDDNINFKDINFYFMTSIKNPFVSKISADVLLAENRVIEFIENYTEKTVKFFESNYFHNAFYVWLTMASRGADKSQVAKLMADDKYEKTVWLELLKGIFQMSEHTAPVIAFSILEKLPLSEIEMLEYLDILQKLRNEFNLILKSNGILIFPSFPSVAPFHNQALWTNTIDHIFYFGIFNALGFPSTQVPLGLNSEGLPIGIQLVSNRYCDKLTIKLANLIEKELNSWIQP